MSYIYLYIYNPPRKRLSGDMLNIYVQLRKPPCRVRKSVCVSYILFVVVVGCLVPAGCGEENLFPEIVTD